VSGRRLLLAVLALALLAAGLLVLARSGTDTPGEPAPVVAPARGFDGRVVPPAAPLVLPALLPAPLGGGDVELAEGEIVHGLPAHDEHLAPAGPDGWTQGLGIDAEHVRYSHATFSPFWRWLIWMLPHPRQNSGLYSSTLRSPGTRHSYCQSPQSRQAKAISEPVTVTVEISFRNDRRVRVGSELVKLDVLAERVKQALYGQTQQGVILAGDGRITLEELFSIADQLMAGGVKNVALQSQPPRSR
jgi:biopolymer transport protein ExbD